MAEAHRNDLDPSFPEGLLAGLRSFPDGAIRPEEVARARRHAAARTFDDGAVVEEIAAQILLFSRS